MAMSKIEHNQSRIRDIQYAKLQKFKEDNKRIVQEN